MLTELDVLDVLVADCQASGATVELGALLEIGWTTTRHGAGAAPIEALWVTPPSGTRISRVVRELTGWSEACLEQAVPAGEAWSRLCTTLRTAPAPCVIHYARFERGFLEDLHRRHGQGAFPLDIVCVHEIARRLYPELPRRNLRALAGFLGHSPQLERRAAGHVDATAFIWRALVPALAERSVRTWDQLKDWLNEKAPPRTRRSYPLPSERRRALPERPGVYRFLRCNGDVLYVGKATNLKKRVSSHFTQGSRSTERAFEMLTQVHTVEVTPVDSILEAALLETDEIKRLAPPYNVQLLEGERRAWFATPDMNAAAPAPDGEHRLGPLPSRWALTSLAAIRALASGGELANPRARAAAVGVPPAYAPDEATFRQAWESFRQEHIGAGARNPWHALLRASKRLALTGVAEGKGDDGGESPPDVWDLARVRRHLDRALLRGGLLLRRARWLVLLSEACVAFREAGGDDARGFRLLVLERGEIVARTDIADPTEMPARQLGPWRTRQAVMDAARYDRLRVLATELARVRAEGGTVVVKIGDRLIGERRVGLLVG
jgi:predicted GIY-YIG superfamily endonuclease